MYRLNFLKKSILIAILSLGATVLLYAQSFDVAGDLKKHVEYLSSESLKGRKAGSEGETRAASYLYTCLEKAGVIMLTEREGQDFTISSPDGNIASRNIVGIIEGSDPALREEFIVVGAHFDGLGVNEMKIDGKKVDQVFPGADDNASGVATLIELAKAVAQSKYNFKRSIIFVGFGAEECGMAGSWYFVNRAFEQIGSVKAMINLDMLGRGNEGNPFQIFSQVSGNSLTVALEKVREEPVMITPVAAQGVIAPSDHLPFYEKGIPVVVFTTGMTREYHTLRDAPKFVLYNNMTRNMNYIYYFLKNAASEDDLFAKPVVTGGEKVYSLNDCDVKPQFFHSDEKRFLDIWVYKYLKYPEQAIKEGIQGRVLVSFIIEKDGSVSNVEVAKGVDELLDDEAVKVISISPKWIPGEIDHKKVRVKMVLPVEFRLKR